MKALFGRAVHACAILALGLGGACQDGGSADFERSSVTGDFREFYESRLQEVSSMQGSVRTREPGVIRIDVPQDQAIYFFTTQDHPAHPAIVKRSVVQRDGQVQISTEGWTDGSRSAFEDWLRAFQAQDQQIRQRF